MEAKVNKIITLDDIALRDKQDGARAWILWKCKEQKTAGKLAIVWDGTRVEGEPVLATINYGRWGARCKVCGNSMYVSWRDPVFYCTECGNGGSGIAWGVTFPINREEIEAALLIRPLVVDEGRLFRTEVELAFQARPAVPGLVRSWRPGVSVDELMLENEEKGRRKR